jgi:hypothetical protein
MDWAGNMDPLVPADGVADRNQLQVPVDGTYLIPWWQAENRPARCKGDASSTMLFSAMCSVVRLLLLIRQCFWEG